MKKIIYSSLAIVFIGCVSVSRSPSAIDKNNFVFNLYGTGTAPNGLYKFHLLNLSQLNQKTIEFQKYDLTDAAAENAVQIWQEEFRKARRENKDGFQFEYKKAIVDVDSGDMKNLEQALEALDKNEKQGPLTVRKKIELISSFNEKFKDAVELKVEVVTAPLLALSYLGNYTVPVNDAPALQVPATSFWQPRSVNQIDMLKGHGQLDISRLDKEVCNYNGPKKGYGVHAGFKVKCSGMKLKVKFGNEVFSAPLNSRLYHRIGYNVPAIHHIRSLKMAYDRKLFTEINARKTNLFRINLVGKEVKTIGRPRVFDASSLIVSAQLKNGQNITTQEFSQKLLLSCNTHPCDYSDSNINKAFEAEVATLTFKPSAVVEEIGEEIGPWHYSDLDHGDRTELKGLLVLGAWTGNYDLRKDNNKLAWVKETGEMKHFISDPGSGLSNQANPWINGVKIEDMKWSTTMESRIYDGNEEKEAVVFNNFRTLAQHDAFRRVSFQDGQWMTRLIAGVSEDELSEALIASGFSAAEFLLLREKLVSIQQQFIKHFKLTAQFPERMRVINKKISFDPSRDTLEIKLKNGRSYKLENRNVRLQEGSLVFPDGQVPNSKKNY